MNSQPTTARPGKRIATREWAILAALAGGLMTGRASAAPEAIQPATNRAIVVFAASSTTEILTALARRFEATHPASKVTLSFASSSVLARQIEQGAPCDVFVSADVEWMDYLSQRNGIQPASRKDVAGNRLVIIAPTNRPLAVRMEKGFDFAGAFAGRLALGDPEHVPAGKYAQAALSELGWWEPLKSRLAPAENVRAALRLVERGETDAGVVYRTDALASRAVSVAGEFPERTHPPIRYPAALCPGARLEAVIFLDYIAGPEAAPVWAAAGFVSPSR